MRTKAERACIDAQRTAFATCVSDLAKVDKWKGKGIFGGLLSWEIHCIDNAVGALRRGNVAGGLSDLYAKRGSMTPAGYAGSTPTNIPDRNVARHAEEGVGVLGWLVLMLWGLWWMFSTYPLFAIIFLLVGLAIWSVLGGAICRIAALHAAREEKIGMSAAVKFGLSKFFSFYSAPLLPVAVHGTERLLSPSFEAMRRPSLRVWVEEPLLWDGFADCVDPVGAMTNRWREAIGDHLGDWWAR